MSLFCCSFRGRRSLFDVAGGFVRNHGPEGDGDGNLPVPGSDGARSRSRSRLLHILVLRRPHVLHPGRRRSRGALRPTGQGEGHAHRLS